MFVYLFHTLRQRLLRPGSASASRSLCAGCFGELHVSVLSVCIAGLRKLACRQ